MKNKKLILSIYVCIALIFISTFLCSCGKQTELSEKLIIKSIGVDKTDSGNYSLTILSLNTDNSSEEQKTVVSFSDDKNIKSAVAKTVTQTGKTPYMGQNLFIVLGDYAKHIKMEDVFEGFLNSFSSAGTTRVYCCEGSAKDLLTVNESINPEQIYALSEISNMGSISIDIFKLFNNYYNDKSDYMIPILKCKDKKTGTIEESGGAIFNDDGYCGSIKPEQVVFYKLLVGDKIEYIAFDGEYAVVDNNDIDIDFITGEKLKLDLRLTVKCDNQEKLSKNIKEGCEELFRYLMEVNCDCINIGRKIYLYRSDIYNGSNDIMKDIYNADFSVTVNKSL